MTDKEFETLLKLAYLDVDESEKESLKADIADILKYVEQLQDVELPDEMYKREVIAATRYRDDKVVAAESEEFDLVKDNFPSSTEDGLVEAHGVLSHK